MRIGLLTTLSLAACGAVIAGCRPAAAPAPEVAKTEPAPLKPAAEEVPEKAPEVAEQPVAPSGTGTDADTGTDTATGTAAELPPIPWLRDHDQAFAQAKKAGKPILIDFWCGT